MDRYIYLLLTLGFTIPLALIFLYRQDLRSVIIKFSLVGIITGLVCEYWYFKDYWRPPSLLGTAHISVEDALFGMAVTALGTVLYPVITSRRLSLPQPGSRKRLALWIAVFGLTMLGGLVVGSDGFGYNSIFVTSGLILMLTLGLWIYRRDLMVPSIVTGIGLVVIMMAVYSVLFVWLAPNYWNTYWLLARTQPMLLGHIPWTEALWYFSWGSLAGCDYLAATGRTTLTKYAN